MVSPSLKNKTILITGSAGFIGSSLVLAVLRTVSPVTVIGIDSMNDYYDVSIKEWRLKEIEKEAGKHPEAVYRFIRGNIADRETVREVFSANSHFLRTAGPHFPDSPGHIKRTAWDISRAEGTPPH